ncbi:MAG: hypothetical protein R3E95_21610 [Thiolinea sp.]
MADIRSESNDNAAEDADPFGARSRLEQCHRNNAELRRELQETQEQLELCRRAGNLPADDEMLDRLRAAEARVTALMDDLQLRDDTIAVLEKELEQLR